jgi:acetylornithine deacetylase/succinyl-diaminopimelate desuccinylase-like protein
MRASALLLLLTPLATPALSQSPQLQPVKDYVAAHHQQIFAEFLQYASLPDLHGDNAALARNADLLKLMFDRRNMHAELWSTPNGAPVVFAEKIVPGSARTILFYIHYDGQPVDAKAWAQPDPFVPVVRTDALEHNGQTVADPLHAADVPASWRIYARGAGDDKLPAESLLTAIDAVGPNLKTSIKVYLDGEEEGSGPSMEAAIRQHPDQLKSDLLIICDGPQHPSGRPTMYFGARGGANLSVTVYTARNAMHSGNYGNWMPDANVRLAQLLSSMVSPTGKVVIDGFYSDVLPFSPQARRMIDIVPDNSAEMQAEYGVGSLDGAATSLQEALNLPTFSVHKMQGGEDAAVIASHATADIAMRLVKENDPAAMVRRVIEHIRKQGYFIVQTDPDLATLAAHPRIAKVTSRSLNSSGATGAWRTEPDQPQAALVSAALEAAWPGQMVRLRTLGGGVPAGRFIQAFHVPTIGIALANYDDNQHSDNENARMGNLYDGVITFAGILEQ